jgi:hypothetical protein
VVEIEPAAPGNAIPTEPIAQALEPDVESVMEAEPVVDKPSVNIA